MLRYIVLLCIICFMLLKIPNAFAGWGPSPTRHWITGVPSGLPLEENDGVWYSKHDKDLDDAILNNKELDVVVHSDDSDTIKTRIIHHENTCSPVTEVSGIIRLFVFHAYLVCVIITGILLYRLVKRLEL